MIQCFFIYHLLSLTSLSNNTLKFLNKDSKLMKSDNENRNGHCRSQCCQNKGPSTFNIKVPLSTFIGQTEKNVLADFILFIYFLKVKYLAIYWSWWYIGWPLLSSLRGHILKGCVSNIGVNSKPGQIIIMRVFFYARFCRIYLGQGN